MIDLCKEPETNYFPSRQRMERLEGKSVVVLDVEEATGRPRLVAALHVAPNPRIGLFVSNDPVNYIDPTGEFAWIAAGAAIGAVVNVVITYAANEGNVTGQQLAAAAASGAISGALGAAAGPLGGTIAKGLLGTASNGLAASVASGALSAGGAALGQSAANAIDPCNATNPLNAALYGGLGGGLAKGLFPTKNLNTWAQAQAFGPKTVRGLFGSSNAWLNLGSFATSSGVGGAANFPGINPF